MFQKVSWRREGRVSSGLSHVVLDGRLFAALLLFLELRARSSASSADGSGHYATWGLAHVLGSRDIGSV